MSFFSTTTTILLQDLSGGIFFTSPMHNLRFGVPAGVVAAAIFRANEHLGDMEEFVFLATRNQLFFLFWREKQLWEVVQLVVVIFAFFTSLWKGYKITPNMN